MKTPGRRTIMMYLLICFFAQGAICQTAASPETCRNRAALQLSTGLGIFTGEFGSHLDSAGAWPWSPVLDGLIVLYPAGRMGIGLQWGSMAVIHPQSEPIEGILRYQSLFIEYPFSAGPAQLLYHLGAGFQDAGMLLSVYSSGFWNTGLTAELPFGNGYSFVIRADYRRSFFTSLIIYREYEDWTTNDNLQSLSLNMGLRLSL